MNLYILQHNDFSMFLISLQSLLTVIPTWSSKKQGINYLRIVFFFYWQCLQDKVQSIMIASVPTLSFNVILTITN